MNGWETVVKTSADRAELRRRHTPCTQAIKRPKEVSLGEHTSLGPKATAPITVICLSPDLTLGVSSRTYSAIDTRRASIKFALKVPWPFVNRRGSHFRSDGGKSWFRSAA